MFSNWVSINKGVIFSKQPFIERKIVVINSLGILENILFKSTQILQDTSELSSNDLYAIGQFLKNKGESLNIEKFQSTAYTSSELANLKKLYPLNKTKYLLYKAALGIKLSHLKQQQEEHFTAKM